MKHISRLIISASLTFTILVILPFMAEPAFFVDLLVNLQQYALSALVAIILISIARQYLDAIMVTSVCMIIAVGSFVLNTPIYQSWAETASTRQSIVFFNVERTNQSAAEIVSYFRDQNIDAMVFFEATERWKRRLEHESNLMGFDTNRIFKTEALRDDFHGILVWSRKPIKEEEFRYFGYSDLPMVSFVLGENSNAPRVFGVHGLAPITPAMFHARNAQLSDLASWILASGTARPVIVGGDFNLTPYSYYYRSFLTATNLLPVNCSFFGTYGTWPTWLPLIRLPLDHIFVSRDVAVSSCGFGPKMGSDHYPLILQMQ